jgi:hypothetical protein
MEITKEIAEKIINSRSIVDQPGVPYKGIEVVHVGYTNSEGEEFLWENTDEPYAIVSLNASTPYQLEQAVEEFIDEDYDSACNHNVSIRMNVEKARELSKGVPCTLVMVERQTLIDDVETTILVAKSVAPVAAITAKKASLADILAKKDVEPKVKAGS